MEIIRNNDRNDPHAKDSIFLRKTHDFRFFELYEIETETF
jgi:hypothetical protein